MYQALHVDRVGGRLGRELGTEGREGQVPHRLHSFSPCLPQLTQVPSAPRCMHTSVSRYTSQEGKAEAQIMNR